jgi:hypothetical protein
MKKRQHKRSRCKNQQSSKRKKKERKRSNKTLCEKSNKIKIIRKYFVKTKKKHRNTNLESRFAVGGLFCETFLKQKYTIVFHYDWLSNFLPLSIGWSF